MDVNQDKPSIISWRLWRKAMKLWANEDTLHQSLGKWYKSVDTYKQNSTSEGYDYIWNTYMARCNMMPFAWKVVDVNSNAYFCHAGLAFGKESLFRTEAYVTLSVLCFMH
eukprot:14960855-Ditylum_brightwellii.AAC.1